MIAEFIRVKPFNHGMHKLIVYDRHQGYILPNGKVTFLTSTKQQCILTREEKEQVKAWVANEWKRQGTNAG